MDYKELSDFIKTKMSMQHIYQPVMIKTLLQLNGRASADDIAKVFLAKDQSQIDYYKIITKNMPGKVLRGHKIVEYNSGGFFLNIKSLTKEQKDNLIELCNQKIEEYETKHGKNIWKHRSRDSRIVPGSLRFIVLKRAKERCELCGISKDEKALDVDHIIPVNKGGKTVLENLQALCYTCNSQKRDLDQTDFRAWHNLYDSRETTCPFCKYEKTHTGSQFAFVVNDQYPVTKFHTLICPRRHIASFFELSSIEYKACLNLLEETKNKIKENDHTVTGFNVGINIGEDAGQTIFHCHIHLIPRRKGDVKNPKGGIRNILPEKGNWQKLESK
jgi:diadenosine tetraphosphate (Ap4A) HIT family hydrolase/5-methylcytosine-specific restriction endonuclease McrA